MKTSLLISILALFAAAPVFAQDESLGDADDAEESRLYTVEVIIFSYEEDVAVGTEVFPPDEPPEELSEDALLDDPILEDETVFDEQTEEDEAASREVRFELLPEDEFTMQDIARKFALLDVYETIMHFGWTQVTIPEEEPLPIELRVFGNPPAGLDGQFTLYLSRFLHLIVDLELEAPGQSRTFFGDEPDPYEQRTYYRIQEDRIFKSGDIRYFDHPRFGVVARITRVEETQEDEETQLLGRDSQ